MLVYLNGVDDIDTLGKIRLRIPTPPILKKIVDTTKKLVAPIVTKVITPISDAVKKAAQDIVEKAKEQAKKIGAGVQRLASIPQSFANKAFLRILETNFNGYATRTASTYKIDPSGLKAIASANKIPWSDIISAINKGLRGTATISGSQKPDYQGDCKCPGNTWGPECCKKYATRSQQTYSANTAMGADAPTAAQYEGWTKGAVGILKQIIAWFKKHGKHNQKDQEVIEQMGAEVDADPTIPKYDENGTLLPNADGSFPPKKEASIGPVIGIAAAGLAAKALLFS